MITLKTLLLTYLVTLTVAQESCSSYGNVRLVGGSNEREGRVEVCIGGVWGTVCHRGWSSTDARVVCRQLGFEVDSGESVSSRCCASFGQGSGPIYLNNVRCTGRESYLLNCMNSGIGVHNCRHSEDAGVRCPSSTCTNGDVRLAGGLEPTEGRVEVCMGGRWRGVCSSRWNYQDAFVVCRQLGHPATAAIAYTASWPGVITNLTSVRCRGTESGLLNCIHAIGSCSSSRNAGVRCYGDIVADSTCTGGGIRLAGGSSRNEGRVEVCGGGLWGTVCSGGRWDNNDATVVCRQLGYLNSDTFGAATTNAEFGQGSGPIHYARLSCSGSEISLSRCGSIASTAADCSHNSDVGVRCAEIQNSGCTNGTIRLADGQSANEGRVEICIDGVWGSVCDDDWNTVSARIVCRELGLPFSVPWLELIQYTPRIWLGYSFRTPRSQTPPSFSSFASNESRASEQGYLLEDPIARYSFRGGSGLYHLDDFDCNGDETSIFRCSLRDGLGRVGDCAPRNDAGVSCLGDAVPCTNDAIRLADGRYANEGRVEVCVGGLWAAICNDDDDDWTETEGAVICRQLTGEANPQFTIVRRPSFGRGLSGRPYFSDVVCNGRERRLADCTHTSQSCSHFRGDVGIRCYVSSGCADGEVRLAGGRTAMEGRVEVCLNATWWLVSGTYWDLNDTRVVCRQLGYPTEWATPLRSETVALFGRGSATFLVRRVNCNGSEALLHQCNPQNFTIPTLVRFGFRLQARFASVAGAVCNGPSATSQPDCTTGDLRLVGGERESEGRVEVCVEGFWGTVCDSQRWGREEAMVVCRQLGQPSIGAISINGSHFGDVSRPVIGGISCSGTESNLTECNSPGHTGLLDCVHRRAVGVLCQDTVYTVTVITDPPNGPHFIGSTVNLTCLIHPQPPEEGVTYRWRDYIRYTFPAVANFSLPYATLTIGAGHPRTARYYCQVYLRNKLLTTGSVAISVHGLLQPLGPTLVHYNPPETITFRLNMTLFSSTSLAYLRALTWYHNGTEIFPNSDRRISLSTDRMTLTIASTSVADIGVYHAEFAGLSLYPFNELCEQETVALLRPYPILSPAVFQVYASGMEPPSTLLEQNRHSNGQISFANLSSTFSYTSSDSVSMTLTGNAPGAILSVAYTSWYSGGSSVPSASLGRLQRLPSGLRQTLSINNPTPLHSNTYEAVLWLSPFTYLTKFGCPSQYRSFSNTIRVGNVIIDQAEVVLNYYEPPAVSLQAGTPALRDNENTTLSCRADGGYPPTSNISWVKNGRIISTASTNQVTIDVAASDFRPFGVYECLVNNSATVFRYDLLLKETGNLQLQLDLGSSNQCGNQNISSLEVALAVIVQQICSCNFNSSGLYDSQISCSGVGGMLMLTTSVEFASASGDVVASDIIQAVQHWAQSTPNAALTIDSNSASVVQVCSPSCTEDVDEGESTSGGLLVVLFFVGLVMGLLLIAIPTAIVCSRRTKIGLSATQVLKKTTVQHTHCHYASKNGDLQTIPNIAYNSVQHPESNYELVYDHPRS